MRVMPRGAPLPDVKPLFSQAVRERWNDYGIGLLLQGDLKAAEAAFLHVTEMDPGYADGPVNVARAQIQEGNVAARGADAPEGAGDRPELAKAHYFLGTVLKTTGRYDEALVALRAAAAQYPRDRVVLDQIGRVLFLQRKFSDAVKAFEQVLLGRSGGSAGALQPDGVLSGTGATRTRGAGTGALRAIQGRRIGAGHHRAVPSQIATRQQRTAVDPRTPASSCRPRREGRLCAFGASASQGFAVIRA